MTTATEPAAIARATLEDRYDCLMIPPTDRGFTKLGLRFQLALEALVLGVARHGDVDAGDGLGAIAQEASDAVRALIVSRIDERGLAR